MNSNINVTASFLSTTDTNTSTHTFYIDYEMGNDANNGTSKTFPWKRHPFMNGFGGSYSHQAGDHFIFKGGVVWPSSSLPLNIYRAAWNLKSSGTAENPDYYGVDKAWYKGSAWSKPVLDGEQIVRKPLSVTSEAYIILH